MRIVIYIVWMVFTALSLSSAWADGVNEASPQALEQKSKPSFSQTGRASYYHKTLRGLKTANGERYDPNAMTAAHRRLKLGTYVRVTHLRNKRSIIVKVNDRLPPHGRAIIDLSTMGARKLGMIRAGIAKVRIETLSDAEVAEHLSSS
jgi:rare lipoprotein A